MTTTPPAYRHPGPPPEPPEYPEGLPPLRRGADTWKWWSALVALALAFAFPIVGGIIAGIGVAASGGDVEDMPAGVLIGLTFVQDIGFILAPMAVATWFATRVRAEDLGLRIPEHRWRAVGLIAAVYVGFIVFSAVWVQIVGSDAEDTLPDELGVDESTVNLVLVLLLVVVMAPVAEEILFRGYVFRALRNGVGTWAAAVISGIIFGGIHVGSSPIEFIVPLCVLGAGLALLYQWTGSLYAPVALHAFNNSIAFGVTQDWGWEIGLTLVGSIAASLLALRLIAGALGSRRAQTLGLPRA